MTNPYDPNQPLQNQPTQPAFPPTQPYQPSDYPQQSGTPGVYNAPSYSPAPTPNVYTAPQNDKAGLATAAMVVGIISLIAWLIPICGFPLAIGALVLGIMSRQSSKRGQAMAGIIMGGIAIALSAVNAVIGVLLVLGQNT